MPFGYVPPQLPQGPRQADVITLYLPESGQKTNYFESYSFDSNFMEPTDAWSCRTGGKELPKAVTDAFVNGAKVQLIVNGSPQATGYIDSVVPTGSRGGGKTIEIHGADTFAPVVRGGADPYNADLRFTQTQSLEDLIVNVFSSYGFTKFEIDDAADRALKTGLRPQRFSKKKGKPLKKFTFPQQLKPTPGETSWQYVIKIAERMGLYIWPSADGETVIVSTPDYDQAPVARIVRQIGTNVSNVISGGIGVHTAHQPSCIIATGFAGGGEWSRAHMKVMMINELVGMTADSFLNVSPEVLKIVGANLDTIIIAPRTQVFPQSCSRPLKWATPVFYHDEDSKSVQQLANFVRRKMSSFQKEMWVGEYEVYDHTYFDGTNYIPWTVNTMVDVVDEVSDYAGPMWVCGRTFTKDAKTGGTKTLLHLVLPHTIEYFGYDVADIQSAKAVPPNQGSNYLDPTIEWVTMTIDGDGRGSVLSNNQYDNDLSQETLALLNGLDVSKT